MINNITIGSDPEFAVFDVNGVPRSAVDKIRGTKKEPYVMESSPNGDWSCQIDNVGAELCIPVCRTKDEFVHAIMHGKKLIEKQIQLVEPDWTIRSVSSARYSKEELDSPTAKMFGCEPSYCIYTGDVSPRPSPKEVGNLRSFGFHIHVGFKTDDDESPFEALEKIIKAMDITLGLGSIIIDKDSDRRNIYGNAGDLRFRQIGSVNIVEYRTLGGAMSIDEDVLAWVFERTMQAVEMANNWKSEYNELSNRIANAINNGDIKEAENLLDHFKITLPTPYATINKIEASIA